MITSFFINRICRAFQILAGVFYMGLIAIFTFALLAVAVCRPDAALAAPPPPTVSAQPVGNSLYINAWTSVNVSWEIQIKANKAPIGNPPSFGGPADKTANNGSTTSRFTVAQT